MGLQAGGGRFSDWRERARTRLTVSYCRVRRVIRVRRIVLTIIPSFDTIEASEGKPYGKPGFDRERFSEHPGNLSLEPLGTILPCFSAENGTWGVSY